MSNIRTVLLCACLPCLLLTLAGPAPAQEERRMIDGIAAIVGDEIILESEVDEEFYIYQMRTGTQVPSDQTAEVRAGILRDMIDEMLLVAMARRDSIEVGDDELESEIDRRVMDLRERHGSQEALNAALEQQGITLDELRDLYRGDIEKRLLAEKVVRAEVHSKIDVTWGEVGRYYDEHKDEVAKIPESFKLAGILISPSPSEAAKREAIERLNQARAEMEAGASFEDVAKKYSQDASAQRGGDLGTVRRGMMVPEFEEALFSLSPGEVSGIVPSRFGFHIIKMESQEGEAVRARHILARVVPGPGDEERAHALAESVRQLALAGADFAELAAEYSDDESTKDDGGLLGWFQTGEMTPSIEEAVRTVEPGGVAPVVEGDGGYYVIKVLEHEQERVASLDEVREELRDYIYAKKAEEAYNALMSRLYDEIYVEVREPVGPEGGEQ